MKRPPTGIEPPKDVANAGRRSAAPLSIADAGRAIRHTAAERNAGASLKTPEQLAGSVATDKWWNCYRVPPYASWRKIPKTGLGGDLAHDIAMQHEGKETIDLLVADIAIDRGVGGSQ